MTVFDLGDPTTLWPATTGGPDLPPQLPPGPWQPRTDDDPTGLRYDRADLDPEPTTGAALPAGVDGWAITGRTPIAAQPPTIDDLGLTADPVAQVLRMRTHIDELIAGMTDQQRADLAQYEQPQRPNLKAVA